MEEPSFFTRIWLALVAPFLVLFDGRYARAFVEAGQSPSVGPELGATKSLQAEVSNEQSHAEVSVIEPAKKQAKVKTVESEPVLTESEVDHSPAYQVLSILQREGRLLDFLGEDVSGFSDAEIGAAARVVHEGCARALKQHVELVAIRNENEGDAVELPKGFDAVRVRVTGKVMGDPPFHGKLAHHGWEVRELRLPTLAAGHDPSVVAPAEVEL